MASHPSQQLPPYSQPPPPQSLVTPDAYQPHGGNWQDMTRTLAHYDVCEQIGEGTYGQVYRSVCKDTGRTVALKKMRIHHGGYWGMPLQLVREIKILKRMNHPNLLELIEVVTSKGVEHLDPDDPPMPKHEKSSKHKETDKATDAREAYKGNLFLVLEYVNHDLTGLLDIQVRKIDAYSSRWLSVAFILYYCSDTRSTSSARFKSSAS